MASPNESKKQTLLKMQMREILGNAYSFVRGRQYNETISNLTYEELLDKAIEHIEGSPGRNGRSAVRSPILDRVKKIKAEISQAVDTVKKQPPEDWGLSSDDRITPVDSQNTPETGVA